MLIKKKNLKQKIIVLAVELIKTLVNTGKSEFVSKAIFFVINYF